MSTQLRAASERAKANEKAAGAPASKFAAAIAGARIFHEFTIPRLDIQAVMTLVPYSRGKAIEGAVFEEMRTLKLEPGPSETLYVRERACRTLAESVGELEAGKRKELVPIGTLADWESLDDVILEHCWYVYIDVRAAADPYDFVLPPEEWEAVHLAVKKKQGLLLRYLGIKRLVSYMLSMADQLSTYQPPRSSSGESSPDE